MKAVALKRKDQNHAVIDPWTAVHLTAGLAFGLLEVGFGKSMGAAAAYDMAENIFERTGLGQAFFKTNGPEHPANIAVDLGIFALGWYIGSKYK